MLGLSITKQCINIQRECFKQLLNIRKSCDAGWLQWTKQISCVDGRYLVMWQIKKKKRRMCRQALLGSFKCWRRQSRIIQWRMKGCSTCFFWSDQEKASVWRCTELRPSVGRELPPQSEEKKFQAEGWPGSKPLEAGTAWHFQRPGKSVDLE